MVKKKIFNFIIMLIIVVGIVIMFVEFKKTSSNKLSVNKQNYSEGSSEISNEQKALQEVANAYYNRGTNLQYCTYRRNLKSVSPEEATEQHTVYTVCSGYTSLIYYQALGIEIPNSTSALIKYAKEKYKQSDVIAYYYADGTKYKNTSGEICKYKGIELDLNTASGRQGFATKLLTKLQVGDVLCGTGHALFVYKIKYDSNGVATNAIIRDANSYADYESTKLTYGLRYAKRKNNTNNINEGTIWERYLINTYTTNSNLNTRSVMDWLTDCDRKTTAELKSEFCVIRPLENTANKTKLANEGIPTVSQQRIKYKGLYIEKTVDVFNNSVVGLGDTITYTIDVKNNSGTQYSNNISIVESYDKNKVQNIQLLGDNANIGTINEQNGTITWNVGKITNRRTVRYSVTVKNNYQLLGQEIVSTGTVAGIPSATIKNMIGTNLTASQKNAIKQTFQGLISGQSNVSNQYKSIYGTGYFEGNSIRDRIASVYKIALNVDIPEFDIKNLISTPTSTDWHTNNGSQVLVNNSNAASNIILNNYYGALREVHNDPYEWYTPYWKAVDQEVECARNNNIYSQNFQTGDILVYKNNQTQTLSSSEIISGVNYTTEKETQAYYMLYISPEDKITINGKDHYGFIRLDKSQKVYNIYRDESEYTSATKSSKDFKNNEERYYSTNDLRTILGKDYYVILRPSLGFDRTPPTLSVSYSTTTATNQNVTATITANEQVQSVTGWTLSLDKKTLTKSYSANATESVTVKDLAGNSKTAQITISNIDKTAPTLSVSYSTTSPTNQNVTATITANEQVQSVSGWTLSSDKKTLTKSYTANATESVTVKDLAGNSKTAQVKITNIDKTAPTLSISYSTTVLTNQNVAATITANEQVKSVTGWTLSSDKKILTKSYSANVNETITVYDLAGNKKTINVKIENISETQPGDLNENDRIDIGDLVIIYRYISATNKASVAAKHPEWILSAEKVALGDLNKNGRLDIGDGLKIQRYIAAKNNTEVANQHPDWLVLE